MNERTAGKRYIDGVIREIIPDAESPVGLNHPSRGTLRKATADYDCKGGASPDRMNRNRIDGS